MFAFLSIAQTSSSAAALPDLVQALVIPLSVVVVTGVASAILLRWAGVGRPGTLAGLVAGVLCGMTVDGRVLPEFHEQHFIGGTHERQTFDELISRQGADVKSLEASGVSQAAIDELTVRHETERQKAAQAYEKAKWDFQRPMRIIGFILAGLLIGWYVPAQRAPTSSWSNRDRSRADESCETKTASDHETDSRPPGWIEPVFIASWMVLLVLAFLGAAIIFVFDGSRLEALAIGLSFAVTMRGSSMDDLVSPAGCDRGLDRLISRTSRCAWIAGVVAIIWAGFDSITGVGNSGTVAPSTAALMVSAIIVAMVFHLIVSRIGGRTSASLVHHAADIVLQFALVPTLTALLTIQADFADLQILGPLILGGLIGGDGRWFGIASGLRIAGVRWRDAMQFALPVADAANVQIAIGYLFLMTGWIENSNLLPMIIAGAVICDLTLHARGRLLLRFQHEIDEAEENTPRDKDEW